jgi:predicted phage tail component-like protein
MFKFNGIDLELYVKVIEISKPMLSRTNYFKENPSRHGTSYQGYKYNDKDIEVKFDIRGNTDTEVQNLADSLCSIFDVDEPKELVVDDNKRIYLAIPNGDIDQDKIAKGIRRIKMSFSCPIPFSHNPNAKLYNGEKTIDIINEGNVSAPGIVNVAFNGDATYCQIDGDDGKAVLIGEYPSLMNTKVEISSVVVDENCETTSRFVSVSGEVDANRSITGTIQPNASGSSWCIKASDYGSGEKWHGPALRYNLPSNVTDFDCKMELYHDSSGKLEYNETYSTEETARYKVTVSTINMRASRTTSSAVLTQMKRGTYLNIIQVVDGWLNTTYNGKTGWVKISAGLTKVTTVSTTYYTTNELNVRAGRGTNYRILTVIPKNTPIIVYTNTKSGNWVQVKYNGVTGYVHTNYIIEGNKVQIDTDEKFETAEDKLGIVEIYGYDQAGNKLFKVMLCDENEYYESTYPLVQVGNVYFLQDFSFSVPKPKQSTTSSGSDDNLTVTIKNLKSGKYGNWNEFKGYFRIVRDKNEWYAEIVKYNSSGNIERTLQSKRIKSENYPTGALNHIVVYFGKYSDKEVVDTMTFNRLLIKKLSETTEENTDIIRFKQGDELKVDFANNEVFINNVKSMENVNVGSKFFEIPPGTSTLKVSSDASITSSVIFNERWLD